MRTATTHGSILLAEDDDAVAEIIAALLEGEDIQRVTSVSAARSFRGGKPQAVLLDVNLTDGCSLDLIDHFRDRWHNVPIIVLTADERAQMLADALARGADDFVTKPLDAVAFLARLEARIRWRQEVASPQLRSFGDFEIDTVRQVLRGPHGFCSLPRRNIILLLELVTVRMCRPRASLMRRLWPDRAVSSNSLDQLSSSLRNALTQCGSTYTIKSYDGERICLVDERKSAA